MAMRSDLEDQIQTRQEIIAVISKSNWQDKLNKDKSNKCKSNKYKSNPGNICVLEHSPEKLKVIQIEPDSNFIS